MSTPPNPSSRSPVPDFGKVPEWLLSHPELQKRGIVLHRLLYPFTVYQTQWVEEGPIYVVKALKAHRSEADSFQLLEQYSHLPSDHTIPHELIRCEPPLVVMPRLSPIFELLTSKISSIIAAFGQIMEGVEYLHNLHIAHGDIFEPNVVAATERDAQRDTRLTAGRVYLIDFESCRQFERGPGAQAAVTLPPAHVKPPHGMKCLDPFSWDIYCLGATLEAILDEHFVSKPESQPWILCRFAQWLKGNEVGCTAVCHCRPRIKQARKVLAVIQLIVNASEAFTP